MRAESGVVVTRGGVGGVVSVRGHRLPASESRVLGASIEQVTVVIILY